MGAPALGRMRVARRPEAEAPLVGIGEVEAVGIAQGAIDYANAITWYWYMDLMFYLPQEVTSQVFPQGVTRQNLDLLRREISGPEDFRKPEVGGRVTLLGQIYAETMRRMQFTPADANAVEREEYGRYRDRAATRFALATAALGPAATWAQPTTRPATGPAAAPAPAVGPEGPVIAPVR